MRQRADLHRLRSSPARPPSRPQQVLAVAALDAAARRGRAAGRRSMKPARQAASSTQPILRPCRSSITRTNSAACISEAKVPVSSQAVPRSSTVTCSSPRRRYSSLTAVISSSPRALGLQRRGRSPRPGCRRSTGRAPRSGTSGAAGFSSIESTWPSSSNVDHAVLLGVGHRVGEDPPAARRFASARSCRPRPDAVEDVVAEDQRDRLVADEVVRRSRRPARCPPGCG